MSPSIRQTGDYVNRRKGYDTETLAPGANKRRKFQRVIAGEGICSERAGTLSVNSQG